MEKTLLQIINAFKNGDNPDERWLECIIRDRNREMHDGCRHVAKRRLLPFYLHERNTDSALWQSWNVDAQTDERIVALLRAKPRRTASGVATVTVLTKPWPCGSDCIYCPNDIRMPKSYLSDEPACQRAERNYFDPYLQVISRLRVLEDMGHVTDKVELIVLGGTWSDYPKHYRLWFATELFCALNDLGELSHAELDTRIGERRAIYERTGCISDPEELASRVKHLQLLVDSGELTYNEALTQGLTKGCIWQREGVSSAKEKDVVSIGNPIELEQMLFTEHVKNETATHRCVGLVIETRPDLIDVESLIALRNLGCTKIQMGIQSLNEQILTLNGRHVSPEQIAEAFALLRLFGFKSHIHMMTNLAGATPDADKQDYRKLVTDERFKPDEAKIYPCALVGSSRLTVEYEDGKWRPYSEDELIDVLASDILSTPPYMRISRMIRDISAKDIVVGNKKTNLRQLVEAEVISRFERGEGEVREVREMRMREIATANVEVEDLRLVIIPYTTTVSEEYFLQWVGKNNELAGFLRLSLPDCKAVSSLRDSFSAFPIDEGEAMIREVHVYGKVSRLHESGEGAQHTGLGRTLVEKACEIALSADYTKVNVISAIGTRQYYRDLGFKDAGLYQQRDLAFES